MNMISLAERIQEVGLTMTHRYVPEDQMDDGWMRGTHQYAVTLRLPGIPSPSITVPYFQGPAIVSEPQIEDIVGCLVTEAGAYLSASSFEEFATDHGYNPDSRKAEAIFTRMGVAADELRNFLGEEILNQFLYETEAW